MLSSSDLTDEQALAMIQMGVKALATRGRAVVFNHLRVGKVYIEIANARFVRDSDGIVRLISTEDDANGQN